MPICKVTGKINESKIKFNMFELGCATGFFNGEGYTTVNIHKVRRQKPIFILGIGQKETEQLIRFNNVFNNLGDIYYKDSGVTFINNVKFTGFETVQFIIACMWIGLSSDKKNQYKKNLDRYFKGINSFKDRRKVGNNV